MPEPATFAAFVVSGASTITAGAAVFAARYTKRAKENSEKAVRILVGEDGIDDQGLMNDVEEHREALLSANLYPPRNRGDRGD
jgi:hypothetical protein